MSCQSSPSFAHFTSSQSTTNILGHMGWKHFTVCWLTLSAKSSSHLLHAIFVPMVFELERWSLWPSGQVATTVTKLERYSGDVANPVLLHATHCHGPVIFFWKERFT